MVDEKGCRLETACTCLNLSRPSKEEWLKMSGIECRDLSELFKALSDPVRIRIVEMLFRDSLYVCLIQYLLDDIKYSRLSYHLDILKKAGILGSTREGNFLRYSLTEKGKSIARNLLKL